MKIIKFRFVGVSPLLMHSDRGADPLDPDVKVMKTITSKRKKTDEDHLAMAQGEFSLALYYDPEIGPYIPAQNIDATMREAAKKNKLGKVFTASARCLEDKIPLKYKGPKSKKELFDKGFYDRRSVVVQRARVIRTRPMFPEWSIEFEFGFDEEHLDLETVINTANIGGNIIGLCDYRPRFGRFEVEVL